MGRITMFKIPALLFAMFVPGSLLYGEVAAQVDGSSDFSTLSITTGATGQWGRTSSLPDRQLLNPDGDDRGDKPPVTAVTSRAVGQAATASNDMAYVIWPRKDGGDFDIFYSAFLREWSIPQRVYSDSKINDFDPSLAERKGKLYLAWWSDQETPKIYYSKFDGNTWSPYQVVSNQSVPSRYPQVTINGRNEVVITYTSYQGDKTTTEQLIWEDCDP